MSTDTSNKPTYAEAISADELEALALEHSSARYGSKDHPKAPIFYREGFKDGVRWNAERVSQLLEFVGEVAIGPWKDSDPASLLETLSKRANALLPKQESRQASSPKSFTGECGEHAEEAGQNNQPEAAPDADGMLGTESWRSEGPSRSDRVAPATDPQDSTTAQDNLTVHIRWSDEDKVFVARIPQLPGLATHGDTLFHALQMTVEAMGGYMETKEATQDNFHRTIPMWVEAPKKCDHSSEMVCDVCDGASTASNGVQSDE
jgi:predicted RNase H-like HicB family nuclease